MRVMKTINPAVKSKYKDFIKEFNIQKIKLFTAYP